MRTLTTTTNLYQFTELSPEAQATAIDSHRDTMDYDILSDDMRYYLDELLTKYKLVDRGTTVRYSLGYSQGDGASFTGDIEWGAWRATVGTNHWGNHYQHWNSVEVTDMTSLKTDKEAPQATIDKLNTIIYNIGKELERLGYDVLTEAGSPEAIAEVLRDEFYEFTVDGTRRYWNED